jgi:hypothetical protein
MLRELVDWIDEDQPPPNLVEAEAAATNSAVSQIASLLSAGMK